MTMEAITKRAVVVETPRRRRHRDPAGDEHGPRRSTTGRTTAPAAPAFLRDVKAWLEAVGPETLDLLTRRRRRRRRPMRVLVTGGAGFIGSAVVRRLRARGDEVVAVVRDPDRARGPQGPRLRAAPKRPLVGRRDPHRRRRLRRRDPPRRHVPGRHRGATSGRRCTTRTSGATERVLDAAIAAGVPRIVHVSTVNVFGDTRGRVVDETYRRDPADGFVSWYDETKYRRPRGRRRRIAAGAPIVIAMPGQAYGPGDHSRGRPPARRRPSAAGCAYLALTSVGILPVHVDDLAAGHRRGARPGRLGESYVLAGAPIGWARRSPSPPASAARAPAADAADGLLGSWPRSAAARRPLGQPPTWARSCAPATA